MHQNLTAEKPPQFEWCLWQTTDQYEGHQTERHAPRTLCRSPTGNDQGDDICQQGESAECARHGQGLQQLIVRMECIRHSEDGPMQLLPGFDAVTEYWVSQPSVHSRGPDLRTARQSTDIAAGLRQTEFEQNAVDINEHQ